ncbi:hypothetical protein H6F74_23485 [Trichocoleus sp. FACHB-90]|uniref:hypothetical protein n=1 Tax=Cyanophyceae TaxID=3028117 RepID=UPI0016882E65|nr:hypothetical protein [Trichocoleus sp. FACHB-90]MBD1929181.1 hypothetical protein [Trichocoleus sp. FACHB-90]
MKFYLNIDGGTSDTPTVLINSYGTIQFETQYHFEASPSDFNASLGQIYQNYGGKYKRSHPPQHQPKLAKRDRFAQYFRLFNR